MARSRRPGAKNSDVDAAKPTLAFETTLWAAADKLRGNMDASEYKHVALGLIFLKYISDRFAERRAQALIDPEEADLVDEVDLYLGDNVFWVPEKARWDFLKANAVGTDPSIGATPPAVASDSRYEMNAPAWSVDRPSRGVGLLARRADRKSVGR